MRVASLWRRTRRQAQPQQLASSGEVRTCSMRIVVLGSGIIGVTSAYQLARDGHEVIVVDRQPTAGNETSFANTGLIAPGHSYTWNSPQAPKVLGKVSCSTEPGVYRDVQLFRWKRHSDGLGRDFYSLAGGHHRWH